MLRIASLTAAGLGLISSVQGLQYNYNIDTRYTPDDFGADKWSVFNSADPTAGYINYVDRTTAESMGLLAKENGAFQMKIDTTAQSFATEAPKSVRIESAKAWRHFLIVGKFNHLPKTGCGIWPAFWTLGQGRQWPQAGEMNMYESWNAEPFNRPALHMGTKTTFGELRLNAADFTGTLNRDDCDNEEDNNQTGCVVFDEGAPYGSADGGVYAIQFESDRIAMWRWTHDQAPVDLDTAHPDIESFGKPVLVTPASATNLDNQFLEQRIIINLDVCGGAPEATWNTDFGAGKCSETTSFSTCAEYAKTLDGSYFEGVSFGIEGITIWTQGETTDPPTSSEPPADTTTAGTTTAVTSTEASTETSTDVSTTETSTGEPEETAPTSSPSAQPTGGEDDECSGEPQHSTYWTTGKPTQTYTEPEETDCPDEGDDDYDNGGNSDDMTTSTITATMIETVTSCAPVVTDCSVGQVTTHIVVTTTVCPKETAIGEELTTTDATTTVTSTTRVTMTATVRTGGTTTTTAIPSIPEGEEEEEGVGGDDELVEVTATVMPITTVPYTNGTTPTFQTVPVQMSSSISMGCLSGAGACITESPDVVEVSSGNRLAIAGSAMLTVAAALFFL